MQQQVTTLAEHIRSATTVPLTRLDLASAKAAELVLAAEALVSEFVDECRQAGHPWSQIAPHLPEEQPAPNGSGSAPIDDVRPVSVTEHTGKYRPLWLWLTQQTESRVEVTFGQVEEILGFSLPPSSRAHLPHWYGYTGSAVARAIIDASWCARNVNLADETVTLMRTSL